MIYVTQPNMPPLEEFTAYLEQIWESKWLTNQGPFHQELEEKLCTYLGVDHISLFSNGTLALLTALQALHIGGEVITTPFSFVATTHALWWNNIKPVFVDIDPKTFNLDPDRIEAAITPQTSAILPVHVYGNPCANDRIQQIADTYGLKVIYDAAHAFGIKQNDVSVLRQGDLSVLSFHSTKVFTTIEGGAIVSPDLKTKVRIDYLKNFGFADEVTVVAPGINAKLNEIQSAYGLLQLKHVDENIRLRSVVDRTYREQLTGIPGLHVMDIPLNVDHNYGYFPITIDEAAYGRSRDQVYDLLKEQGIYTRRYFYPLISEFPVYRGLPSATPANLPVAHRAAQSVLCLPIYPALTIEDVGRICRLLKRS
ncbi:MAG: DegT/DnrJ/EryC1/StrS family aminotransferase [Fibrobacteres bacterium]|jgi:dTDP-4-amino-4,6-dideoxygalactose transaminase|nr:DegT/DnrJ/EryC1/StrS family aminotransferase [Fibrobacterota bacterium]